MAVAVIAMFPFIDWACWVSGGASERRLPPTSVCVCEELCWRIGIDTGVGK